MTTPTPPTDSENAQHQAELRALFFAAIRAVETKAREADARERAAHGEADAAA